jgi:hypothetical protein
MGGDAIADGGAHGGSMGHRDQTGGDREALYDIQLGRRPPESMWSQYPSAQVRTTGAQTALLHRASGPGQLDALLQKLRSMGLVLMDVHRLPVPFEKATSVPTYGGHPMLAVCGAYEVRVKGELGEALLRYLRWPHYVVPEQTLVRIPVPSADLCGFLRACTEAGASIERVRMIHPELARVPANA